jgi:hypothetical protein
LSELRESVAAQPGATRATGASGDAVQNAFRGDHGFSSICSACHFVCLRCKAGWLTRQCQTTDKVVVVDVVDAWKPNGRRGGERVVRGPCGQRN